MGTLYGLAKIAESGVGAAQGVQAMRERSAFKDYTAENPDWVGDPDKAARAAAISPDLSAALGNKADVIRKMQNAKARNNLGMQVEDDEEAFNAYNLALRDGDINAPINAANYGPATRAAQEVWNRRMNLREQQQGPEYVQRFMPPLWEFDVPGSERDGYAQRKRQQYAVAQAITAAEAADAEGGAAPETYNVYGADGTPLGGALSHGEARATAQAHPGAQIIKTPSTIQAAPGGGDKWRWETGADGASYLFNPQTKERERVAEPGSKVMEVDGALVALRADPAAPSGFAVQTVRAAPEKPVEYRIEKTPEGVLAINPRDPADKILVAGPDKEKNDIRLVTNEKSGEIVAVDLTENVMRVVRSARASGTAEPPTATEHRQLAEAYDRASAPFLESVDWLKRAEGAQPNATGDNVLRTAFARSLEPVGILSDRDKAAINAGTLPEWIAQQFSALFGTGTIDDAKRRNIVRQIAENIRRGAGRQRTLEETKAEFAAAHGYDTRGLFKPYAAEGEAYAAEVVKRLGAPEAERTAAAPSAGAPGGPKAVREAVRAAVESSDFSRLNAAELGAVDLSALDEAGRAAYDARLKALGF